MFMYTMQELYTLALLQYTMENGKAIRVVFSDKLVQPFNKEISTSYLSLKFTTGMLFATVR